MLLITVLFSLSISFCSCRTPSLYQITPPVEHAEGPTWDSRKGILYFVDIHAGGIYSFQFSTGLLSSVHLKGEVSPVIPSRDDPHIFLVGLNRTLIAMEWDGRGEITGLLPLVNVAKQFPRSRFNDGKADKSGRLWLGTMGFEDKRGVVANQGLLYKITHENIKHPEVVIAPVNISNGLAWNKANDKFYYVDTPTRKVMEYEFSNARGYIRNGKVLFDLNQYKEIKGFPDGMTIDVDDNLWIALYGGGAILKVDTRNGKLLQVVMMPVDNVTSVMWGGPHLDILFVTTSRVRLSAEMLKRQPSAGSVFAITGLKAFGREVYGADVVDLYTLKHYFRGRKIGGVTLLVKKIK